MAARPANRSLTARERARAELTHEIRAEARRQLAQVGAAALSLRSVARELGMVSSAVYRYYPSKEDLLTALIIDAYNAVGDVAEAATAGEGSARQRWTGACRAIRGWARAHPHEYALIYGSPVPGYRAPEATIGPASRVPLALVGLLRDAAPPDARGPGAGGPGADSAGVAGADVAGAGGALREQAATVAALIGGTAGGPAGDAVPPEVLIQGALAWTQLFGLISFELFGQYAGSFDPADDLFDFAVVQMARLVGL
jgi:AcrR family transcriptional regulator